LIQDEIFSIQEANLNDSDWLDEFERSIFSYNHKNIYRNILKTYKDNNYYIFIGILNNSKIGYIVGRTIHDELNIYNLAILEKYRNKGFASKLLCYVFEHMNTEINSIYIEVRETNIKALKFYRKFGFIEYNIRENYYSSPTENAILMQYKFQSE
jgi:ribosomal-protein-alanine N-acetyltransferase|tara:strand:+ start:174 stop:638 length:465 start_codon:yes stop_codon:yes gene_type:complete